MMAGDRMAWWRRAVIGVGAALAVLAVAAPVAWANTISNTTGSWYQQSGMTEVPGGTCNVGTVSGSPNPVVGYGQSNGASYLQWAFGYLDNSNNIPYPPSGATLIGGTVSGTVAEAAVPGQSLAPAGSYYVGVYDGYDNAQPQVQGANCLAPSAYATASGMVDFPGNQNSVSFSFNGYSLIQEFLMVGRNGANAEALSIGNGNIWFAPTSPLTLTEQYAYTPSGITPSHVAAGSGTQTYITWNANGNNSGTTYDLQRETIDSSGGVSSGWTTIYQGTTTHFTTTDQACGVGYVYRVNVPGPSASTPWDTSAQWDEYPCSVSLGSATTTSITASWPEVTPQTVPKIVWCEIGTPGGGVSCQQQWVDLSAGTTSMTLTGLVPNAEYMVFACSTTDPWGCPNPIDWTYAAQPTLSVNNNSSGLSYDQQPFTWTTAGNAPGTAYCFQQWAYSQSGALQGGSCTYYGPATSATANQSAGGSYLYQVWANSAGYGVGSPYSNGVPVQVAPTPSMTASGSTTATVSWAVVANESQTGVQCGPWGGNLSYQGPSTSTSWQVTGLTPNTSYYCAIYAVSNNQGIQWWQQSAETTTDAATPTPGTNSVTQSTINACWGTGGNPAGTTYQVVLDENGANWAQSATTTSTCYTFSGLGPGLPAWVYVQAVGVGASPTPQGVTPASPDSQWTNNGTVTTVPAQPSGFTGSDGGLGWSSTAGRGYVNLSWNPVTGATGYDVLVWDGNTYESFTVGTATSWNSQQALIYPPDASLYANVSEASKSPPVFSHNAGGLNLRDLPLDLYCTTGTYYCTQNPAQNYWFAVDAFNASGSSADFQQGCGGDCYQPMLPLQTDAGAPTVTSWQVNGGAAYTYASKVSYALSATESPSGIAGYALSNNGTTWTQEDLGNCTVGQVFPCMQSASFGATWTLTPGPGSKTVYARVESAAGVWSAPSATTVYVNQDTTVPTVNVVLDGGQPSTNSTSATAAVSVSDPVTQQAGLTFQTRYSTNGGQSWSGWQSEGGATAWNLSVTLPGGASGQRSVLVEVQDSDDNRGQGGATIQYVNPSGPQAGTVKPTSLRGFYAMPTNFSGGASGVATFVRGVATAVGAGTGVVYSDSNYPIGWEAATPTAVASALGWPTQTASQLASWMQARISGETAAGSLVVLSQGVVPDTIAQTESSSVLLVQYMQAGGSVVWSGDVPMYNQGQSGGGEVNWGCGGGTAILGVNTCGSYWSSGDPYTDTPLGQTMGLQQVASSSRSIPPSQTGVYNLATDNNGGWASWFKPFSSLTSCVSTVGLPTPIQCTTQPQVTVALSPPSSTVQMRASLSGVTWGPWQAVASSLAVNLGTSPGLKTLWVQYKDAAGDVTAAPNHNPAYYVYDPGRPVVAAGWLGNASATDSSGNATMTLQASDDVSAALQVQVTENGSTLYSGSNESSIPLTLNGSGFQDVQVIVTDAAGNATTAQLAIYVQ